RLGAVGAGGAGQDDRERGGDRGGGGGEEDSMRGSCVAHAPTTASRAKHHIQAGEGHRFRLLPQGNRLPDPRTALPAWTTSTSPSTSTTSSPPTWLGASWRVGRRAATRARRWAMPWRK